MPIPPENLLFDRKLLRQNRNRAANNLEQHRFLLDFAMDNLLGRLADIKRTFPYILQIGSRTSAEHDKQLQSRGKSEYLLHIDLSEKMLLKKKTVSMQADEELLPFADNIFNLVISALDIHTVNDLPGTLIQIRNALKPDGVFLAAMLGGNTLHELRHAMTQAELNLKNISTPHIAPFADKRQIGDLLQRTGFTLPVVDSEKITVTYDNIFDLMHDLRGMGEGNNINARSHMPTTKALIEKTEKIYQEQYTDASGRLSATFEIIFMIGWKPHSSQPKPLKPGSAKHSMAEALETKAAET